MAEQYNPAKLKEHRYGILGFFAEKLVELQKGKIPIGFEKNGVILKETLPFFSNEERPKIQEVLNAGLSQAEYFRSLKTVNALDASEKSRREVIDSFLTEANK